MIDNRKKTVYIRRQEEYIIENENTVTLALDLAEALKTKKLGRRQAARIRIAIIEANNILEEDPRYIYVEETVGTFMLGLAVVLFVPMMIVSKFGILAAILFFIVWGIVVNRFGWLQSKITQKLLDHDNSFWVRKIFIPKEE